MAKGRVNHDLRVNKGKTLWMPEYYEGETEGSWTNMNMPSIYSADDATALYPRGCKLTSGERVFFYGTYRGLVNPGASAYTVTATNGDDLGGKILFSVAYGQDYADSLVVRKVAGDLSMVINTTVDDGGRADNWYSGGWVAGKDTTPADERMFWRRIVKHDYQATGNKTEQIWNETNGAFSTVDLSAYSEAAVLELDEPIINSKTTMAVIVHTNEWKHAIWQESSGYVMNHGPLGACMHNDPTAGRHVWLQTWGQMYMAHQHAQNPGSSNSDRVVILMGDGSMQVKEATYDYWDSDFPVMGMMMGSTIFETATIAAEPLPMVYLTLRR